MPAEIPTDTTLATYVFSVELDRIVFGLRLQFNERDQSWFFDLLTAEGVPIRQGIKIVTNFPLLRLISAAERPPGEIFAIDTTGEDKRAGLADLGDQVKLVYYDESEVPALGLEDLGI